MSNPQKQICLIIDDQFKGLRADIVLVKYISSLLKSNLSRSKVSKLFDSGCVLINNIRCRPSYKCRINDQLKFNIPFNLQRNYVLLEPYSFDLDILFEDKWVIVVNKPAGLVVHPGAGHTQDTLVNALIYHKKKLSFLDWVQAGQVPLEDCRPGIVHRIDKDTSGLLLIAKDEDVHQKLAKQFATHKVDRHYWACVFGVPQRRRGEIKSQIARNIHNRKKFQSFDLSLNVDGGNDHHSHFGSLQKSPRGKKAITYYEVIESFGGISLLHLKLATGRTHQIRVHLSNLGHPILGDKIYGRKRSLHFLDSSFKDYVEALPRLALHAARLRFYHPYLGRRLEFEVGWPDDLLPFAFS